MPLRINHLNGFGVGRVGTPGGGPPTDPNFSSTVLLLGFEGSDGATSSNDESFVARGAWSNIGNGQIDTAQFKFGTSSLLCDGVNDGAFYADSADWSFGSGQFTVEVWVRFNSLTGFQTFAAQWGASNQQSWLFDFPGSANNLLRFAYSTTGADTVAVQGSWTPTTGVWYHVAADRDSGGTLRIYANGTMIASGSANVTFFGSTTSMAMGVLNVSGLANDLNGWMDELRITKGVGRYVSDGGYTTPTASFPRS
jgi:hypothetical protein